jgi:hypothetical protein
VQQARALEALTTSNANTDALPADSPTAAREAPGSPAFQASQAVREADLFFLTGTSL